jgi:hypothetical protein
MSDLTDEAKKEIQDAIAIVASDKGYGMMKKIHDHLIPPTPENDPGKPGDPTAPPKKEDEPEPDKPKKRGLWNVGNTDE